MGSGSQFLAETGIPSSKITLNGEEALRGQCLGSAYKELEDARQKWHIKIKIDIFRPYKLREINID